jgi:hypothetical protein
MMVFMSFFQNRLSILNTDFIRFCIQLDSRVRPLMMAVRMVAKRKGDINCLSVFKKYPGAK